MAQVWIYALLSVLVVSLVSFVGILTLSFRTKTLQKMLLYMVSFSTGALFGDVFLHLLPEVANEQGFTVTISLAVLFGIVFSFVVEKVIHWRHCHVPTSKDHPHPFAVMNLFGDAVHNFLDGMIIGVSYLVSIPVGLATTVAVVLHEIPQEIGDFGVLLHGGFSRKRAILFNFLSAVTAFFGMTIALIAGSLVGGLTNILVPFAAGGFVYIAGSDLIPELHKEENTTKSLVQLFTFLLGIALMAALLLLE
ncbi:ZIP family metal transporter [Candidatus Woesearchaeota archaeon]|nr:ZIP family metal transporter [Candidatus Woesearchaeota archaeon]